MHKSFFLLLTGIAVLAPLRAQTFQQNAIIRGGGDPRQGACTIQVLVDGVADVEIRGASAFLRNEGGGSPQWRRFECTGVLPPNPANFRFQPTNGRGRQSLVRDPRQGGVAVIRIEDPQGGAGEYRFDIAWSGGEDNRSGDFRRDGDRDRYRDGDRDRGRDGDRDRGRDGVRDRDPDGDRWHEDRRNFRGDEWRGRIFERVREDLEHVQAETFPGGGDQYRLGQARRELNEMQDKLAAGRYDERELDDVVRALREVVRDNRLAPRDRDMLSDDLDRLRDFRERHESYGAR